LLAKELKEKYAYDVRQIKVSKVIEENAHLVGGKYDGSLSGEKRIASLQDIGNKLREKFTHNYIIEKCVEKIAAARQEDGFEDERKEKPLPKRRAHIIDSIKHPAEYRLLKDVYGDVFWLFTVFAPEDKRQQRLVRNGFNRAYLDSIFARDEDEDKTFGQKVRDTAPLADFFIRNDKDNDREINEVICRYLEILFDAAIHTPTKHESAMYKAMAAASRSACMSRQVGAAIVSGEGDLLSVGWNDVPKFGGGVYQEDDLKSDQRCFVWGTKECHNDAEKEKLYSDIYKAAQAKGLLKPDTSENEFKKAVISTRAKNLIEFSRSIHAEMQAIVSIAKDGRGQTKNSTIYCTTIPCHNCARHIVASGMSEAYYIEPYPKSMAIDLHSDAITLNSDERSKVRFLQYDGVAPRNLDRLFKHGRDRKAEGKLIMKNHKDLQPVTTPPLDDFARHEKLVVAELVIREADSKLAPGAS
jgi:deoxycytidylate deaminase